MTWLNNCCEQRKNTKFRGCKEGVRSYFSSSESVFNTGMPLLCADDQKWLYYAFIWVWTANYLENIHLHSVKQLNCPVCNRPKSLFGERNSLSWQLCDYQQYFQKMILATMGYQTESREGRPSLDNRAVETSEGLFRNTQCISPTIIIIPDTLHTISLRPFKHLMD